MADGRDIVLELIEQRKGDALRAEAAELDRLADKTDKTNKSMGDLGAQSKTLSTRIDEQTVKVRELAREIERGGGDDKGLFKQFRAAERDLGNLKRVSKSLEDMVPELGDAGAKGGTSFMSGLSGAFSQGFPPEAKAALVAEAVGAAAALAPAVGAVIAGAVAGAVGVGGIIGGVAAAFQDQAVVTAAAGFKETLFREFAGAGTQFVNPTIEGLHLLEDAARDIDLTHMLGPLADEVPVLAQGLADMARAMEPGLSRAFEAAGPAVEMLAEHLPEIGSALGDMIGDITSSKGAMKGLSMILDVVEGTLVVVGDSVTWLSDRFNSMLDVVVPVGRTISNIFQTLVPTLSGLNGLIGGNVAAMDRWRQSGDGTFASLAKGAYDATIAATGLGGANRNLTRDAEAATAAAEAQTKALEDQKRALDNAFNSQMALDSANDAVAAEWDTLTRAVRDNGTSLDVTSEKGRANRATIRDQITELEHQRDAAIASGDGSEAGMRKANAAFNKGVDHLVKLADQAGYSKSELEKLAKPYYITIVTRHVDTGVGYTHHEYDVPAPKKRALGGRAFAGEPVIVGDGGRSELFIPDTNGRIAPKVPTSMQSGGGGSGAMRVAPIQFPTGSFEDLFFQRMRDYVRTQFGGDVVVAFSSN